jgi:hypothetical protein
MSSKTPILKKLLDSHSSTKWSQDSYETALHVKNPGNNKNLQFPFGQAATLYHTVRNNFFKKRIDKNEF